MDVGTGGGVGEFAELEGIMGVLNAGGVIITEVVIHTVCTTGGAVAVIVTTIIEGV